MELLTNNGNSLGLEKLGREVLLRLAASVNAAIHAMTSTWSSADSDFAAAMGITYTPLVLEEIDKANMHLGHVPALIDAPIEQYPNLSVLAPDLKPLPPQSSYDQGDEYWDAFYVEMMVKDVDSQERVNARVQRTMEAVNQTIMIDTSFGGKYSHLELLSAGVSDVFIRREVKSRGPEWFWQGARLDYRVRVPVGY